MERFKSVRRIVSVSCVSASPSVIVSVKRPATALVLFHAMSLLVCACACVHACMLACFVSWHACFDSFCVRVCVLVHACICVFVRVCACECVFNAAHVQYKNRDGKVKQGPDFGG